MKHFIFLTLGLTLALWCQAQTQPQAQVGSRTITTAVPFLTINNDPVGAGIGEIGVVAAPYHYGSANQMNPALLARDRNQVGGNLAYTPWLRAAGISDINLLDMNMYANLDRIGVGVNIRRFDLGEIQFTDGLGQPIGVAFPVESQISGNVALRITDNLSAGVGLQYFESELANNATLITTNRKVRSIAANMGIYYQDWVRINDNINLRNSWGVSVLDLGPKVSYTAARSVTDFIPINLAFGIMEGVEYKFSSDYSFDLDFGFQGQKLMVPSEGGRSDLPLLSGMFGSFSDAPFTEEFRSINWQLGSEARITGPHQMLIALRSGIFLENPEFGNRNYGTAGSSLGLYGFHLDFAYIFNTQVGSPLANTVRLNLGYNLVLE